MVRSLKFRVITAISTGRTLAATPRDGRSVSNLNRPGRRGPPRHHSGGTRATTTGTAVVRPPGGTGEAGSLSVLLGAPLVPLSPHRPCPRSREAPGPASWVGGRLHSVRRPHSALRSAPHTSGLARAQPPRPARHAARPRTAAAVRQQAPGHDPRQATRIRRGPPPGQRPLASGPTRNRRSPPPSHRASGTSIQRGRPRPSARPQPLRSPDRPREPRRSPRGPSRAATVSPRLQQPLRSTLSATPPAPARLGIRLKSAPPEPSG
ncbi:hypothetical protein NDU88_004577 [Pleurodeles waltl]|uniref:Uncharacterized protein n=1 Tax=Pleurodeles waltl TaxID=8319 RepID=A0AAV7NMN0_PLEWA|nr:hypothetical protein NDU88_004577 [Pleurodeles waltl]